jgi:hypothetical protein
MWICVSGRGPPGARWAQPSSLTLTACPVAGTLAGPPARVTFQSAVSTPQWFVW